MTENTVDGGGRPRWRGREPENPFPPRRMNIPRTRPLLDFDNFSINENIMMLDRMAIRFEHHTLRINHLVAEDDIKVALGAFLAAFSHNDSVFNVPPRDSLYCQITKRRSPLLQSSRISLRRTRHIRTYKLIIDVRINPTRFLAYAYKNQRSIRNYVDLREDHKVISKRLTLDRKDNFLVGDSSRFREFLQDTRPAGNRYSFLKLMDEVTGWFAGRINNCLRDRPLGIEYDWTSWSISQGEVYYEYHVENAVSTMNRISQSLSVIYNDARFRPYQGTATNPFETSQLLSSFSVQVKLRGSLKLVIYPKTRKVIRFELRNSRSLRSELPGMDLMLSPEIENFLNSLPRGNDRDRWKRNYVTTEFDGMAHIMRVAAHHLAIIIEIIISYLREQSDEAVNYALIPRFIQFLYETIDNDNLAEAVWTEFVVNGFINLTNYRRIRDNIIRAPAFSTYLTRNRSRVTPVLALSALLLSLRQDQTIGLLDEE